MQDRFKFRAWDKNIKQMRSVCGLSLLGPICADLKTEKSRINWDDCILMQCTGIKDENKDLIYEGDIVQILGDEIPFVIEFEQDRAMFVIHSKIDRVCCNFDNYSGDDLYVIGNIYKNPELLEEE